MKDYIEKSLIENGYTDIQWFDGREGYYVLAKQYSGISCINIKDYVDRKIWSEINERRRK